MNKEKCVFAAKSINLLGYHIADGQLKPDPERVKALLDLPEPTNTKALQRILGMFAYYAQWISSYSEKVRPLLDVERFPISSEAALALKSLKECLSTVTLGAIDENLPFTVETDASNHSISATLNQQNRPVAFFLRTLNKMRGDIQVLRKKRLQL